MNQPRVLDAPDHPPAWEDELGPELVKAVIGELGHDLEGALGALPDDLAERAPCLEELYVWNNSDLERLPKLPDGLRVLDVRGCKALGTLAELPPSLEVLILQDCPRLTGLSTPSEGFPVLEELVLRGSGFGQGAVNGLLGVSSALRIVDLSQLEALERVALEQWPRSLVDLRLNGCERLARIPEGFPEQLRRLELAGTALAGLPRFPEGLDFVDLRRMTRLKRLPEIAGRPRTLFVYGAGLEIDPALIGDDPDSNRAQAILEDHRAKEREFDHEVRLVLLGDGRAGKSSLARRLVDNQFDDCEESTHGIRLWTREVEFTPVDDARPARARLRIWDFAGQDLYHNTHRLFLEARAIYLLCGTEHGPGASPRADQEETASDRHAERHDLAYWRGQVESLQAPASLRDGIPLAVVRTKKDRDGELPNGTSEYLAQRADGVEGLSCFEVSASDQNDPDRERLMDWISEQVGRVLGPERARKVPTGLVGIKHDLRPRLDENEQAFWESERRGRSFDPPYRLLERREFEQLAAEHDYEPDLALERLHGSGFFYYDRRYLPEQVVLDQRWAIEGIYSLFERERSWRRLTASHGRFTQENVAAWVWNDQGYSADHQQLLLRFMRACGMAYSVGHDGLGREEFVAPAALPSGDEGPRQDAERRRGGLAESRRVRFGGPTVGRDVAASLMHRLGEGWGRAATVWRWGGQVESYRGWRDAKRQTADAFLEFEWSRREERTYDGTLEIVLYGEDAEFLAYALEVCAKLPGLRGLRPEWIDARSPAAPWSGAELRLPPSPGERELAAPFELRPIEIGISFAGDGGGDTAPEDWRTLPKESRERWPLALAEALGKHRHVQVEHYRIEQGRTTADQEVERRAYLDRIASRDFVVVFLSRAYLESVWCMYELLQVKKRMPLRFEPTLARVGTHPDGRMSPTDPSINADGDAKPLHAQILDHWSDWYERARHDLDADVKARMRSARLGDSLVEHQIRAEALKCRPDAEWLECVRDGKLLHELLQSLRGAWPIHVVSSPDEKSVNGWADEILEAVRRPAPLLERAREAWSRDEKEHAASLMARALLHLDPDGSREPAPRALSAGLEKLGISQDDLLHDVRRYLQERPRESPDSAR